VKEPNMKGRRRIKEGKRRDNQRFPIRLLSHSIKRCVKSYWMRLRKGGFII
jgi:hypothetical protein